MTYQVSFYMCRHIARIIRTSNIIRRSLAVSQEKYNGATVAGSSMNRGNICTLLWWSISRLAIYLYTHSKNLFPPSTVSFRSRVPIIARPFWIGVPFSYIFDWPDPVCCYICTRWNGQFLAAALRFNWQKIANFSCPEYIESIRLDEPSDSAMAVSPKQKQRTLFSRPRCLITPR